MCTLVISVCCMSYGRPAFHARLDLLASSCLYSPKTFNPRLTPSSFRNILVRRHFFKPTQTRFFASMKPPIERVTDKLEAPALDNRSYRVIRLTNKLEALLVHDPDTDKAGAAVNVNVGSFSDADDMPGMAHAVEHLLFMGTKKVDTSVQRLILSNVSSIQERMPTTNTLQHILVIRMPTRQLQKQTITSK